MLIFNRDPLLSSLLSLDPSVVAVPFNPTAENIGLYLLTVVGPEKLSGTEVTLTKVVVEETRKCGATVYA